MHIAPNSPLAKEFLVMFRSFPLILRCWY